MINALERKAIALQELSRIKITNEKEDMTNTKRNGSDFSILSNIGNTPLIQVGNSLKEINPAINIYAKAEWFNPGGSVKDRAALNMILEGELKGELTKDKIILDATSGNTGIAYAMIGAAKGYKVKLAVPSNLGSEKRKMLDAYGAELIFTDPLAGTDGAQEVAKKIYNEQKDKYFYPDQYNNPANWQAHYKTTANEIWEQTKGKITHFISGLGTTGTFTGTSRRLKELNPDITCIAFQPDSPLHGLEGLKHLPTANVPGIFDENLPNKITEISTEESYKSMKRLAKDEGLLVGASSGAAFAVSIKTALEIDSGVIVTIFPDSGVKYLNDNLWK